MSGERAFEFYMARLAASTQHSEGELQEIRAICKEFSLTTPYPRWMGARAIEVLTVRCYPFHLYEPTLQTAAVWSARGVVTSPEEYCMALPKYAKEKACPKTH